MRWAQATETKETTKQMVSTELLERSWAKPKKFWKHSLPTTKKSLGPQRFTECPNAVQYRRLSLNNSITTNVNKALLALSPSVKQPSQNMTKKRNQTKSYADV